ncbi:hypothetical protein SAMN05444920_109289 [Nonomuraea solani]|uniref:Uncharacterized protein n=1 Tax=Nonomuraea solani TaxID=1144553 RepID=A0A1H6EEA2_9ACTN|nr:hypothetical protein SAMN05444920_109289 [Nonomuraea solani]
MNGRSSRTWSASVTTARRVPRLTHCPWPAPRSSLIWSAPNQSTCPTVTSAAYARRRSLSSIRSTRCPTVSPSSRHTSAVWGEASLVIRCSPRPSNAPRHTVSVTAGAQVVRSASSATAPWCIAIAARSSAGEQRRPSSVRALASDTNAYASGNSSSRLSPEVARRRSAAVRPANSWSGSPPSRTAASSMAATSGSARPAPLAIRSPPLRRPVRPRCPRSAGWGPVVLRAIAAPQDHGGRDARTCASRIPKHR